MENWHGFLLYTCESEFEAFVNILRENTLFYIPLVPV